MNFDDLSIDDLRARRGKKWSTYGGDVLAAWVADMDLPAPEPVLRALGEAVQHSDLGYAHLAPEEGVPAALAGHLQRRFDWRIDPARVEALADVVQGLYVALDRYSEPGDGAVIMTPIYPPFLHAVAETQRRPIYHRLELGPGGYEIDFDRLRNALDDRTRVLMLCNPHNPTGRAFTRTELEGLAAIVLERELVVLADEIHADMLFDERTHIPFATLSNDIAARTVTFTSATKAFNIAGLRCAVAVFGSEELQTRFNSLPKHFRGGVNGFGMRATRVAWDECEEWLDLARAYLQANRDLMSNFIAERMPDVGHVPPEATYLAWLDCGRLDLKPSPFDFFLQRARVALSNGADFGPGGAGFVRLNFATSRPILEEILERMASALNGRRSQ